MYVCSRECSVSREFDLLLPKKVLLRKEIVAFVHVVVVVVAIYIYIYICVRV